MSRKSMIETATRKASARAMRADLGWPGAPGFIIATKATPRLAMMAAKAIIVRYFMLRIIF